MDSNILIENIRNRNEEGLKFLYKNYSGALMGIIVRIVNSEKLAEEILQQTFLKVWSKIDTYDQDKSTLFTWMARIARNSALDQRRLKSFENAKLKLPIDKMSKASSYTTDHSNIDVNSLLDKMQPKYKMILEHIYLKGFTHHETASLRSTNWDS